MKKILIVFTIITINLLSPRFIGQGYSQGNPWGGSGSQNGGGPPPPPDGYCQQFPNDPACGDYVSVPIGGIEGTMIFLVVTSLFFYYKFNGNSFKFK